MKLTQEISEKLRSRRFSRTIGVAMISLGVVMLISVGAYYAYAQYSRANLDDLSFEITTDDISVESTPANGVGQGSGFTVVDVSEESTDLADESAIDTASISQATPDESSVSASATEEAAQSTDIAESVESVSEGMATEATDSGAAETAPDLAGSSNAEPETNGGAVIATDSTASTSDTAEAMTSAASYDGPFLMDSFAMSYPGVEIHPKYWNDPLWAGGDRLEVYLLPEGFVAVSYKSDDYDWLGEAPASRMVIDDIGVDAVVDDLRIIDLGDSQAYETPKNIVGHIPNTANPGEYSNGWYFGHLQSPIRGEGNVFQSLPKLSELIVDGDPIFVRLYSEDGTYLYQVVKGEVVEPTELELAYTEDAEITLVTCYPPLVYDHRYVVTAKLVGVRN